MADERRRDERAEVSLFASVTAPDGRTFTCPTYDLSAGGIQLQTDESLPSGTQLKISFELPDTDRTIDLEGEVMHQAGNRVGVRFGKVPKQVSKALARFVDESY